jgi:signal transduction histidine kinase
VIPPEVRHHIFLTCKEAITNVVRHAKATEVRLRLKVEEQRFVIEIQDNGRGLGNLDEKAAQTRNGLKNMRKRMEQAGGDFEFGPAPGGGALVRLSGRLNSVGSPSTG